ncbi:MAG TPA: multidrug efflux RND transporter permease subunit [Planctomycetota bacterium]|nr:multidrug efflux RND transporter permease subunit [Planctomycetota bacterium]
MISRVFIARPITATVLSLVIVLAGLASMRILPIAQYPEIAPPQVLVKALYPGASAQVLEQTVAAPIENQISGVEDLIYMDSTSGSNGALQLYATFEIGSDIDRAALEINNRIKQVDARLPEEVRRQGVTVEKASTSFLQVIAFTSPDGRYDDLFTSNYVTLHVLDELKRLPGTTSVQIFGAKDYAMRVWLQPDRMAQLGVTISEVRRAIQAQNAQFAPGKIGEPPTDDGQELVWSLTAHGRLADAHEFESIVVRATPGFGMIRLADIAKIELGAKDYGFVGRVDNVPATLIGIFLQPGANALQVGQAVRDKLAELSAHYPPGLKSEVTYDTTSFVEVSIREVVKTLAIAALLVFLVVFLFLQSWRATLIPALAVPVSLIGTFAGLHLLGYSINTLTLFGMVLAIGIVVDDAIVVLENVERLMHEQRLSPRAAAVAAMQEVTGPVIAIVLVLIAAFVPIAFLGGLTGVLFRQFAVTIAIAVTISGFVALTLTPALCAALLKNQPRGRNWFFRAFDRVFETTANGYTGGVRWLARHAAVGIALFLAMVAGTGWLWWKTPSSLVPQEDQGFYIAAIYLPDGSSLHRTDEVAQQVTAIVRSNPANDRVTAFAGLDFLGGGFKNNAATMFITQKHWDERPGVDTQQLIGDLLTKTATLRDAYVQAMNPAPILGLGQSGGFELWLQNQGDGGPERTAAVVQQFMARANQDHEKFKFVVTLWRATVPQLHVDLDRDRAAALGIPIDDAFDTVSAALGTVYVNDFTRFGRNWQVLLSAEPRQRDRPGDVEALWVHAQSGAMVPASAFASVRYENGPETLSRFNNQPAVKFFGEGAPGMSSGQTIAHVEALLHEVLPPDFTYGWSGASFQEKRVGSDSGLALAFAALMVFLILAAQYERWSLPFAVLLALPFGTFGALAAVKLRDFTNDVYFQIGLVTLLGLAAKNAILIVEFAVQRMHHGVPVLEAVVQAARLRFRPILMTSLAFILGVLPLTLSTGAGAGARQSVGTGVMGGMLSATFLAIFFVPMFLLLLARRSEVHATTTPSEPQNAGDQNAGDQSRGEPGHA